MTIFTERVPSKEFATGPRWYSYATALEKFPEDTLRIRTGHITAAVRGILTVSEVKNLEKLAEIADKVMESSRSSSTIADIAPSTPTATNEFLVAETSKLKED